MSNLLIRHSDVLGDQNSYDITYVTLVYYVWIRSAANADSVLIVHDVLSAAPPSQTASLVSWIKDLLGQVDEKARIAEFVYSLPPSQFTWPVLAEFGGVLLDNWLLKANDLQVKHDGPGTAAWSELIIYSLQDVR
jgi:hypothetical protein